ncbi:hypothetical protein PR048_018733 [Dryococelus australis]|uniref:Uncharacterized protein n=1 Tax=Dryococelus australis TaxID=614101 RepID=A0ABQ9HD89_9NEOP|nr:hypothetical protein PR048_018733 [Dryococelus australis]
MSSEIKLLSKEARIKSFEKWKVPCMDVNRIANSGYVYSQVGDLVQCVFCKILISSFEEAIIDTGILLVINYVWVKKTQKKKMLSLCCYHNKNHFLSLNITNLRKNQPRNIHQITAQRRNGRGNIERYHETTTENGRSESAGKKNLTELEENQPNTEQVVSADYNIDEEELQLISKKQATEYLKNQVVDKTLLMNDLLGVEDEGGAMKVQKWKKMERNKSGNISSTYVELDCPIFAKYKSTGCHLIKLLNKNAPVIEINGNKATLKYIDVETLECQPHLYTLIAIVYRKLYEKPDDPSYQERLCIMTMLVLTRYQNS